MTAERPVTKNRFILTVVILIAVVAAGLVLLARTPLLLRSAAMISGPLFGYDMTADSFSFYPLKADLKGFTIADTRKGNFLFTSSRVSVSSSPGAAFKGDVEKVILRDPRIRIRLGDKKETETDLSFIRKIPPVRLLTMENGEFILSFKGSEGTITLKKIDLSVKDFSPDHGGALAFTGLIAINQPGGSKVSATGRCRGQLNMTGILPDMVGKGTIEIEIDDGSMGDMALKGVGFTMPVMFEKDRIVISRAATSIAALIFTKNGQRAELKNGRISMNALYQTKSKAFVSDNLQITMPGVGTLKGAARMTFKGAIPLSASLETQELNFSNLFGTAKSFLSQEEAKKWSIEGSGSLKARMEGTLAGKAPSFSGTVTMDVKKGGFSSPDGSKAAQGINGTVILNFSLPRGDKDASMKISSEMSSGEYLWGKYYKDLKKEPSRFSSKTDVTMNSKTGSQFAGTCDLFNTGRYAYDGFFGTGQWGLHLTMQDVAVKRIVSVFAADYLGQTAAALKGIEFDGKLDADVLVTSTDKRLATKGNVKLSTASLNLPAVSLGIRGIDMDVPFDLAAAAGNETAASPPGPLGIITITGLTKGTYSLPEMKIPVTAHGNDVSAPGIIAVPFYGGSIRVRALTAKDILGRSPKLSFGASMTGIDLPKLLNDLTGLTFPGTVKARFPSITYQNGELTTEGGLALDIFGGRIEAADMYVKDLFSPSRKIGGDIHFSNIDLGKITETIKVGKITGVIEGSLKDLVIEYGQPSRFVFDLDTVKKSGVPRKVSVDAIENISILGTGSGGVGAVLKSGLNKFFKEYPYSRIGIRCTLENDNFNIRGKIIEGGKEYLIRRAFLRGIDVVNRDPMNMVSFKDMQERIGRVFQKEKNGGGPTIKVN